MPNIPLADAVANIIAAASDAPETVRTRRILHGDNGKTIAHVPDASVDLLYMDPPFGSKRVYNSKYGRGFTDVWNWGIQERDALEAIRNNENPVLDGIEYTLGDSAEAILKSIELALLSMDNAFTAYILHMGVRIPEYMRVLKPTGNFIIHCDQTASHIIKAMFDAAFGRKNFRNEIIWDSTATKKNDGTRKLPRSHDTLLVWGKTQYAYFGVDAARIAVDLPKEYRYNDGDGRGVYRHVPTLADGLSNGESGQMWRGINPAKQGQGQHWRISRKARAELGIHHLGTLEALDALDAGGYLHLPKGGGVPSLKHYARWHTGQMLEDIWADLPALSPTVAERLGYPTQKPVALLERLIRIYSPEGGHVFDPFGGCGTTVDAAERLGRSWTICDVSIFAIDVIDRRMTDAHGIGEKHGLVIEGDWPGTDLAKINALPEPERRRYLARLVGAASLDTDRKGDATQLERGIHGHFKVKNIIAKEPHGLLMIAPTGGNVTDVEVLKRLRREDEAQFAVLITDAEPTEQMRAEAVKTGKWTVPSHLNSERVKVDRIQFITVADAVAGGVAETLPSGIRLALPYVPAKKIEASLF